MGGTVRNCLFTKQGLPTGGSYSPVGTVYVAGGKLVNCTVAGNESHLCAGVWVTGGNVLNCLIGDNVTTHENSKYAVFACDETLIDRFDHCMAPIRISKGSFEGANLFRNAAAGDYRLWADSPARDKGVNEGWMTGARDLRGGVRVTNRKVDIGACEYQAVGFSVIVR